MTKICKNLNWNYRQMLVSIKRRGGFIRCKKTHLSQNCSLQKTVTCHSQLFCEHPYKHVLTLCIIHCKLSTVLPGSGRTVKFIANT